MLLKFLHFCQLGYAGGDLISPNFQIGTFVYSKFHADDIGDTIRLKNQKIMVEMFVTTRHIKRNNNKKKINSIIFTI